MGITANYSAHLLTANTALPAISGTRYNLVELREESFAHKVVITPLGANADASVARLWRAKGAQRDSAEAVSLIGEVTLPTSSATSVAAQTQQTIEVNQWFERGDLLFMTIGTAANTAGWHAVLSLGDWYAARELSAAQGTG